MRKTLRIAVVLVTESRDLKRNTRWLATLLGARDFTLQLQLLTDKTSYFLFSKLFIALTAKAQTDKADCTIV